MPPPVYVASDYALQFQRLLPRGRIWHRGLPMVQDADITTLMPTWSRLHLRLNDLIAEIFPCTTYELLPEWEATLGLPDCGLPLGPLGPQADDCNVVVITPASGTEVTLYDLCPVYVDTGPLVSLAFFLPPNPIDGTSVEISFRSPVLNLSIYDGDGAPMTRTEAVCAKFVARGGQTVDYFIRLAASLGYEITIEQFAPFYAGINRAGDPVNGAAWAFAWRITAPSTQFRWFRAGQNAAGDALATWFNPLLRCFIEAVAPAHTVIIWASWEQFPIATMPTSAYGPGAAIEFRYCSAGWVYWK